MYVLCALLLGCPNLYPKHAVKIMVLSLKKNNRHLVVKSRYSAVSRVLTSENDVDDLTGMECEVCSLGAMLNCLFYMNLLFLLLLPAFFRVRV